MAVLCQQLNAAIQPEFAFNKQILASHRSNYLLVDFRCLSEMTISALDSLKYHVSVVMASFTAQIQLASAIWV